MVLRKTLLGAVVALAAASATGTPPAPAAPPASSAAPGYLRMKLARVVDPRGFEKPLTALTLLVPVDWTLEGEVAYDPKNACTATLARVAFRASSPDGRTAVELFPSAAWGWSDDTLTRQFLEQDRQAKARFGMKACEVGPPVAAKDYLVRRLLPRARSGARVLSTDVDPEAARGAAEMVRQLEADAAQAGLQVRLRADTARVRVAWDRGGLPEEEWLTGVAFSRGMMAPTLDPMTGQMGQALSYVCGADFLYGLSAPAGSLEANERLFRAIVASVRVDPEWQARVQQVQASIQAAEIKGAADRSRIIARSAEETHQIVAGTYQRRQESLDRTSERWSQAMRGVETFRNPSTGETVELSSRYGNAWTNGMNEYLLSDSPTFDPGTVSRESWTRLQAVEAGRPRR
jgi:hypothetical protein